MTNSGAGTANAIVATNAYPVSSDKALVIVNITADNTATGVTLAINGGSPLAVKTAAGNDPVVGGLKSGMLLAGPTASGGAVALTCSRHDPQFNCRLEEVEIGGSATIEISQCEIFPGSSSTSNAVGIEISNDGLVNYLNVSLNHVGFGCDTSATLSGQTGVAVTGGTVNVIGQALHFEYISHGFSLDGPSNLAIDGVTGGPNVDDIFNVSSTWTGRANCRNVEQGAANKLLVDNKNGYKLYDANHYTRDVIYPPDPTRGISACRVTSGASVYALGPLVYSGKPTTGTYGFDITPALNASLDFEVLVQTRDGGRLVASVTNQSASGFHVVFRDTTTVSLSDALTDCDDFFVELRHRP